MAEQDKRTINKDINNKNKKSMNVSVKREQSQTGLSFAERKKLRPQVKQTTRQRRGRPWQWLQVMTLMLVMLVLNL